MSLLSFLLVLIVIAVVIYGIKLAFDGNWKQLIYVAVGVAVAAIVLGMLGIRLPDIPRVQ